MNKIKLITGVILLFLVGVLCGTLGTGIYFRQRMKPFGAGGPPIPVRVQILMDRFSHNLNLTDTQKASIKKIVMDTHEQVITLGEKLFPEIDKINENSFTLIKKELNDNQSKKLEILYRQMMNFYAKEGPPPATPETMRELYISDLKERLNLTDAQEKEVMAALKARDDQRQKEMNHQQKSKMSDDQELYEKKLETIFTEKQLEKYWEIRSEENFRMPPPLMPPPASETNNSPFSPQQKN